jgi:transposase-like protein
MSDQVQRAYSTAFKESVVLRIEAGERLAAVAAELGIRRKLLYDWRHAYRKLGVAGLNRKRGRKPGGERSGAPPGRASPAAPPWPGGAPVAARPGGELAEAKARIAELERVIGRQQVDLDFFRKALRLMDATPPSGAAPPSTRSSKR